MDQQSPDAPAFQPPAGQTAATAPTKNKRKILGLWLLIGPSALFIATLVLYAVVNFLTASMAPDTPGTAGFGEPSIVQTVFNVITFLMGIVVFLTWLPGIIAGIILLTTQKKS